MIQKGYFILLIVLVILSGCGGGADVEFEVSNEIDFTTPGGLNSIETHVFVIRNIPTFINTALANNGITEDDVVAVNATSADLLSISNNAVYRFLDEISIVAVSGSDPADRREIFYNDQIDINHTGDLQLFPSISDLKEIILQSSMDMEVRMRFRGVVAVETRHRLIFNFGIITEG